jgi:predicted amidohydrolase YtcJ
MAEVVIYNGKITTQDDKRSFVTALAIAQARSSRAATTTT